MSRKNTYPYVHYAGVVASLQQITAIGPGSTTRGRGVPAGNYAGMLAHVEIVR
jgi:hypothetical protein